ncbi:response regulator transcription factor [Erysipelotrichaceae bacterium HCN-30851]
MKRILIVEDDKAIAELERDYLEANDYKVDICEDGESGLQKALNEDYALVLLDVMLPKEDGFQVCKKLRNEKNIPIILVSAKREDIDKIRGLGLGANDYIVKPFNPSELIARVKSQIANYERLTSKPKEEENVLHIDNLRINIDSHEVFLDNNLIVLPNKEFELLVFLAKHPNIVFSKDQLFEKIWGLDAIGEISTVTVHVNRVREKIEKDTANPKFIETVWGSGYRFRKYD